MKDILDDLISEVLAEAEILTNDYNAEVELDETTKQKLIDEYCNYIKEINFILHKPIEIKKKKCYTISVINGNEYLLTFGVSEYDYSQFIEKCKEVIKCEASQQ